MVVDLLDHALGHVAVSSGPGNQSEHRERPMLKNQANSTETQRLGRLRKLSARLSAPPKTDFPGTPRHIATRATSRIRNRSPRNRYDY
jgi:hypothetical protein